jgi:hypothetical protein
MLRLTRVAFALGTFLLARGANAQSGRGVIVGTVRDSAGAGLAAARVVAVGIGVEALTNDSGAYRLSGLPAGSIHVETRRLGYFADSQAVALADGETKRVEVVLLKLSAEMLPEVVVEGGMRRGKMAAFEARRSRGLGTFITRADIDRRHPHRLSELLRYVAGVYVPQESSEQSSPGVSMRRSVTSGAQGSCAVQFYVDGHYYSEGHLDDFDPAVVEGVEIYRSAAEIPAAFRTRDSMCGVIGIWTRDPVQAGRRP